jgi:uncharacterized protein (DUF488 family)
MAQGWGKSGSALPQTEGPALMTIGHSTRSIEDFLEILGEHAVGMVVDVRTIPRSRHNPQFAREALEPALGAAGIGYLHMPGLGGLRRAHHESLNTGWRNAGFRGFADYMQTPDFEAALGDLLDRTAGRRAALMCAEAVPWRCHRSLISDALLARGVGIDHITGKHSSHRHRLTPFAVVEGTRVSYPAERG